MSWFCGCIQEVLINYANCAVKMAVAPCLNIKYEYKWNGVVSYPTFSDITDDVLTV